jgi:hypothetical protein
VPIQLLRQQASDRGLACADNAHKNQDHSPLNIT